MKIAVNKAHFPVTVLGPGRRIGIWMQGCSIGCKGCVSQDTWAQDPGKMMPLTTLLAWCQDVSKGGLDGVTLSGGEPFDQPQALGRLLDGLAQWRQRAALDFDILVYSGYSLARLQSQHAGLLKKMDALIPEPFVESKPLSHVWRGSSNQPLVCLSDRGRARFLAHVGTLVQDNDKRMQVMMDGQRVWYAGIPARGDMATLQASCEARGVKFEQVSWRP